MPTIICFYHSPCNDGSASAAALQHRLQGNASGEDLDIRFCPLTYNTEWDEPLPENYLENEVLPKHEVEEIYLVDVSMSAVKYRQIIDHLKSIERLGDTKPRTICIDHHSTALDKIDELKEFCDETYIHIGPGLSGATLVWNYFNERFGENPETPLLLRYVADQDIWEWKLECSKEVNAALNVLNGTIDDMEEELAESLRDPNAWYESRKSRGAAIIAMVDSQVLRSARQAADLPIRDGRLLVVNATSFSSELGNYLCEHHDDAPNAVAMIYSIQEDWAIRCSVRSIEGGKVTAKDIAERYGGGGHKHAAGCRFKDYEEFREALAAMGSSAENSAEADA